jgi:hypothetical protein
LDGVRKLKKNTTLGNDLVALFQARTDLRLVSLLGAQVDQALAELSG